MNSAQQTESSTKRTANPTTSAAPANCLLFIAKQERVKGIEPSSSAWKAVALPLSYTRILLTVNDHQRLAIANQADPQKHQANLATNSKPSHQKSPAATTSRTQIDFATAHQPWH